MELIRILFGGFAIVFGLFLLWRVYCLCFKKANTCGEELCIIFFCSLGIAILLDLTLTKGYATPTVMCLYAIWALVVLGNNTRRERYPTKEY